MIVAHVFGLPLEETIPQLAPAAAAVFIALRLMRKRASGWIGRLVRGARGVVSRFAPAVAREETKRVGAGIQRRSLVVGRPGTRTRKTHASRSWRAERPPSSFIRNV